MNKIKQIKPIIFSFIEAVYTSIRLSLGMRNVGVCIYHVRCSEYAKITFQQKPFYLAIPLITLRVLSCNPITAIILKIYNKFKN
ncbi:MAG: membrane protein insertion efficiency factor YidD [bacterium]